MVRCGIRANHMDPQNQAESRTDSHTESQVILFLTKATRIFKVNRKSFQQIIMKQPDQFMGETIP